MRTADLSATKWLPNHQPEAPARAALAGASGWWGSDSLVGRVVGRFRDCSLISFLWSRRCRARFRLDDHTEFLPRVVRLLRNEFMRADGPAFLHDAPSAALAAGV